MATSKVADINSGAVTAASDLIRVSLRTLVATQHLTQAEAETLRAALGPSANRQSVLKAMQTVSATSSPFMQGMRSLVLDLASPGGSSDSEVEASTATTALGAGGALLGAAAGAVLSKSIPGALLGATLGRAGGELLGTLVDEVISGDGGDTPDDGGHTPDDSGDTGQPSGGAGA